MKHKTELKVAPEFIKLIKSTDSADLYFYRQTIINLINNMDLTELSKIFTLTKYDPHSKEFIKQKLLATEKDKDKLFMLERENKILYEVETNNQINNQ